MPPSLAQVCIVLFISLLFTRLWLISVLYGVWWFIDWDTPSKGGRKFPFLCNLPMWDYMRDYFPVKVREVLLAVRVSLCVCVCVCTNIDNHKSRGGCE